MQRVENRLAELPEVRGTLSALAFLPKLSDPGGAMSTVARTVLQVIAGLAVAVPILVDQLGLPTTAKWVAVALGVSAAVTRAMQSPIVDAWLTAWGLGKQGKHEAGA